MKQHTHVGFWYDVETLAPDGTIVDREHVENLMPYEGMEHMLNGLLLNGQKITQWFVGLFGGAYTPTLDDNMLNFSGNAAELTTYVGATRLLYAPGTVVNGEINNAANRSEFTFPSDTTVRGGFISSAAGKGATGGVLLSAVLFASPKPVSAGGILRVTAGFNLTSF